MPLGLYISVPFCRTKCTYCNFASGVFSRAVFERYLARLRSEIAHSTETAEQMGGVLDREIDSIYFGGGTPTLLDVTQLNSVFVTIRQNFIVSSNSEITVECAPGTLSDEMLPALLQCGVNRVSLGVQSFIDKESASVGRLHKCQTVLDNIARIRRAGITNINVDLIAGLPHQTFQSWEHSLAQLIASDVPHASIYMLEVDEDSRLGRELIAGGQKYHAHFVPDEDLTADLYELACDRLNAAGIEQYEISNFARTGFESKHNLKYWTRQPYLGFGVDAHSMLVGGGTELAPSNRPLGGSRRGASPVPTSQVSEAVRFSNSDSLEKYLACEPRAVVELDRRAALEECLFLGLRLNRGVNWQDLMLRFADVCQAQQLSIDELKSQELLREDNGFLKLTRRGRLLSNEVFERLISIPTS